jgi:hypothetical protein
VDNGNGALMEVVAAAMTRDWKACYKKNSVKDMLVEVEDVVVLCRIKEVRESLKRISNRDEDDDYENEEEILQPIRFERTR